MALKDLADVARMAADLPDELQKAQRRGVQKAALLVTREIRVQIRAASGGDNRLSGVGRRGARVGAKYDVRGTVNPTALIRATGPLHFLEHPTGPHRIDTVRGRKDTKRRGRAKALRLANGRFFASVMHPGTTPSRPFYKGYIKTRDKTGAVYDREIQLAIRKALT